MEKVIEHNLATNEIIERDLTAEEIEARKMRQLRVQEFIKTQQDLENNKNSALAKLQDLGLTEDEAKAFLG